MQTVITVNLSGNAYQVDEPGYQALRSYLDGAQRGLAGNPDRAEIVADLEQAIADKCARFLGPHKTVVGVSEIEQILVEMGPVDGATLGSEPAPAQPGGEQPRQERKQKQQEKAEPAGEQGPRDPFATSNKRLYAIADGAWFAGVCNGLGAYFDLDPTIVRVIFVILTFLTGGFWILVYLGMMLILPDAKTPEEHAAAHGVPFNAQELIRRAKDKYAELSEQEPWKREWKKQRRMWRAQRREWRAQWRWPAAGPPPWRGDAPYPSYGTQLVAGALIPVLVVLNVAVFGLFAVAMISLLLTGNILQWAPPADLPLWAGALILLLLYQVVAWPLHAARRATRWATGRYGADSGLESMIGLAVGVFMFWLAYRYVPAVHDFVRDFPAVWHTMWNNLRQSWE